MNTKILFFGRLAEQIGRERAVDVPAGGCTIGELRALIGEEALTAGAGALASVDRKIVGDDARVMPGQEIAFFSALSGG